MTGQDQWDESAQDGQAERDAVLDAEVYDWYQRGLQLYEDGNPAAASQLLVRAAGRVPRSRSVLEALARAQFDAEQYQDAVGSFRTLSEVSPDDDYAQFGWGLAAA